MEKILGSICILVLVVFFAVDGIAAPEGVVVSVKPGAWAMRDGNRVTLDMKSQVSVGDVLITDANGHLQVMFADDSTVSVGPDTEVAVKDFVFESGDRKASFSADVVKGFTRFVTGKVVEQNRSGFSVTTPQATVGIRGTTFAVNVSPEGISSIIGLDVNSSLPIIVTNVKTGAISTIEAPGMAVDAASTGNTSYQTPPGQFSQSGSAVSGKAVAVRTETAADEDQTAVNTSSSAASGEAGSDTTMAANGAENETTGTVTATSEADSGTTAVSDSDTAAFAADLDSAGMGETALSATTPAISTGQLYVDAPANARFLVDTAGKSIEYVVNNWGGNPEYRPDHSSASGVYSGTLFEPGNSAVGVFRFTASLTAGSGSITATQMNITSGFAAGVVAQQGADVGIISGGNFTVGVTVTHDNGLGDLSNGNRGHMTGGFSGDTVSGTWGIRPDSYPTNQNIYNGGDGNFSGAKQ